MVPSMCVHYVHDRIIRAPWYEKCKIPLFQYKCNTFSNYYNPTQSTSFNKALCRSKKQYAFSMQDRAGNRYIS